VALSLKSRKHSICKNFIVKNLTIFFDTKVLTNWKQYDIIKKIE
jgi:hypothetical protein